MVRGEGRITCAENDLVGKATAVTEKGFELIYDKLDDMSPRDVVASSKRAGLLVVAKRRWNAGTGNAEGVGIAMLEARLAALGGGELKTQGTRKNDPIDVTAQPEESRGGKNQPHTCGSPAGTWLAQRDRPSQSREETRDLAQERKGPSLDRRRSCW